MNIHRGPCRKEHDDHMPETSISSTLERIKKKTGACILAHYYQIPEIQEAADYVGDSFALSKLASELPNKLIVFCGVDFMAESAKLLSPDKTVLLPVSSAGCPMANMAGAEDVKKLMEKYPDAAVVSYVNSTTEVKALSHICCTSSNALKVIRSLPHKRIIFIPDKNLGAYAAEKIPEKEFVLFDGYCPPHEEVMEIDVKLARDKHPEALLLVHPECRREVRDRADFTGSTAQIIKYASQSDSSSFIIGTEEGILHPLKKENPGKEFHMLTGSFICHNMKKTTINDLISSLENMQYKIEIDAFLAKAARRPLERMLQVL